MNTEVRCHAEHGSNRKPRVLNRQVRRTITEGEQAYVCDVVSNGDQLNITIVIV